MPTIIDISDEKTGSWFDMDGGGRIQLRTMTLDALKDTRKQTVKKKVEYKRVEGRAERFDVEEINDELQNELFWDYVVMAWENLLDAKEQQIPCTKENKMLLMMRSAKFVKFVTDALRTLSDDETAQAEATEKN